MSAGRVLQVLLVSTPASPECLVARAAIESADASMQVRLVCVDSLGGGELHVDRLHAQPLDLIVLTQSRPGEHAAADLSALQAAEPLARVWQVLGSWCEGEQRTGRPTRGTLRSYAHQFPTRWRRELLAWSEELCPAWSLPVTTTEEDRRLHDSAPSESAETETDEPVTVPRRSANNLCVAVVGCSAALCESLVDSLCVAGYRAIALRDEASPAPASDLRSVKRPAELFHVAAVVWDTNAVASANSDRVAAVRTRCGGAPLLALIGFPRAEDIAAAHAAGVAAVLSKPLLIDDLVDELAAAYRS